MKLWSTADASLKCQLRGAEGALLFIDSKGNKLLAGGSDKSARVWSLETERVIYTLSGSREKIHCGVFSHDNSSAITGGADRYITRVHMAICCSCTQHSGFLIFRCIRLWDLRSGYNVKTIGCKSTCYGIDVATDGTTVVSCHRDNAIRLWDLRGGSLLQENAAVHTSSVTGTCFSNTSAGEY